MPVRRLQSCPLVYLVCALAMSAMPRGIRAQETPDSPPSSVSALPLRVPEGFEVTLAAAPPLVERPLFGAFDHEGRLYVLDSGGVNGKDRGAKPPDVIRRLEDTDGDGHFDRSTLFADKIVFGTGLVWYDNALFVTSPPSLWKIQDTYGDGTADRRTELVTGFAFNQSCSDDVHGACLGPDGRIYFLPGRFPHKVRVPGGPVLREGVGPWLMRCRPDGSEVEFVGGAVGNPVEVAFLPTGDAFVQGTFWAKPAAGDGLRDAVIHAVEGGEYSVRDRDYDDRLRTGDFLPALVPLSATAPSGLTIRASAAWGDAYRRNLFTTHFNTGKVLRHVLTPTGATYAAATTDFITGQHGDVHFTDVLEDAGGSLLAIDTGGWFRACCPASGTAKPQVFGAIYRLTKTGAVAAADPHGNRLDWAGVKAELLVERLDDPRPFVRERATYWLAKKGESTVPALAAALASNPASEERRLGAVWALCRIDGAAARAAVRLALDDESDQVRQAAASSAALYRDASAAARLRQMAASDPVLLVRREAALALGRIGDPEAVADLLAAVEIAAAVAPGPGTRFLEHAQVLALIRIGDREQTRRGLSAASPAVRRAALMALDQMADGALASADVTALLADPDSALQTEAARILTSRRGWGDEAVKLFDHWLQAADLSPAQQQTIVQSARTLHGLPALDALFSAHLARLAKHSPAAQEALLAALVHGGRRDAPDTWREAAGKALVAPQTRVRMAAITAIERLGWQDQARALRRLAGDAAAPTAERLAALRSLAVLKQPLDDAEFELAIAQLARETPFSDRLVALDALAQARLESRRLARLVPLASEADPVELPRFLAALAHSDDLEVGLALVKSLSSREAGLSPDLLEQTLRNFPPPVHEAARPLAQRLRQAQAAQAQRLTQLEASLDSHPGDADRGRELFFGRAQCHLCHRVAGRGGAVGPDLSGIGAIRTRRDLLEAIVFPSATFARGYEPIQVRLVDGRVLTGLVGRESPVELILSAVQDNKPIEIPLRRDDIEEIQLGRVSAMPQGLEAPLTPPQLADLEAFLRAQRIAEGSPRPK